MFKRVEKTYDFNPELIPLILNDDANPLNRISKIIPFNAKVLDIGAGNGLLACILSETHKELIIDGIEPDPYASKIASKYYRHFFCGYAHEYKERIINEDYDFIVLADVIEHINDPLTFLRDLCDGISEKTRIIISVPNIAFGAVRIALLNGEFNYVDSGILEKTHVRFFTLNTLERLIYELGLNIEKLYYLQRNVFSSEINIGKFNLCFAFCYHLLKTDLSLTYQFLLVLTKQEVLTERSKFREKTKYPFLKFLIKRLFSGI